MDNTIAPPVIGALIAAGGVLLTLIANVLLLERARRHEKHAVVTAFRSDIRSIVSVLDSLEIVDAFLTVLKSQDSSDEASQWANAPRNEDYFQLYGSLAAKIGLTPPRFAREVVRFYTFLHASRDSAAPLGTLNAIAIERKYYRVHARNVLLALSQALEAAESVLDSEFSRTCQNDGQDLVQRLRKRVDGGLLQYSPTARSLKDA